MQTFLRDVSSKLAMMSVAEWTMTVTDDRALVRRACEGDRSAFRQIVESHKGQVFSVALGLTRNHHDAEDLVQEVFLRAYQSLGRFRGDAQLATWLHRITVNAGLAAVSWRW